MFYYNKYMLKDKGWIELTPLKKRYIFFKMFPSIALFPSIFIASTILISFCFSPSIDTFHSASLSLCCAFYFPNIFKVIGVIPNLQKKYLHERRVSTDWLYWERDEHGLCFSSWSDVRGYEGEICQSHDEHWCWPDTWGSQ